MREALEIQRNRCGPDDGGMNVDLGKWVKTKFWLPFFNSLDNKTSNTTTSTQHLTSNNNAAMATEDTQDNNENGNNRTNNESTEAAT